MSPPTSNSKPFEPHRSFGASDFNFAFEPASGEHAAPSARTGSVVDSAPSSFEPSDATLPLPSSLIGPSHYRRGKIQVWDFIRDQDLNYHLGNAIKYVCRAGYKDSKVDDLKKAIHYLQNELENITQ
jgi:hypothetical protein